jgi:hypothetical protein
MLRISIIQDDSVIFIFGIEPLVLDGNVYLSPLAISGVVHSNEFVVDLSGKQFPRDWKERLYWIEYDAISSPINPFIEHYREIHRYKIVLQWRMRLTNRAAANWAGSYRRCTPMDADAGVLYLRSSVSICGFLKSFCSFAFPGGFQFVRRVSRRLGPAGCDGSIGGNFQARAGFIKAEMPGSAQAKWQRAFADFFAACKLTRENRWGVAAGTVL